MAADKGSAGINDMLLCLEEKGYFRVGFQGNACHGAAGVPTELVNMAMAVSGYVDPADGEVVYWFLVHHFKGSKWSYWQPEGYDTIDVVDVMIMSVCHDGSGGLSDTQAAKLIADHGNATAGRISIDTFSQLSKEAFAMGCWASVPPLVGLATDAAESVGP